MNVTNYLPDHPTTVADAMIMAGSGPEPIVDSVTEAFLWESYLGLKRRCQTGGLLQFTSLGLTVPWLFRLTFRTIGLVRSDNGEVTRNHRHVVAVRFPPDYLHRADRFQMMRLIQPSANVFHPNISPEGAICLNSVPGASLEELCLALHDIFRWRLRQYDERDALNPAACAWGRQHIDAPIDDRPLFGKHLDVRWQNTAAAGAPS